MVPFYFFSGRLESRGMRDMRRTISGMTAAPLSTLCFVAVVAPTCPPTNMPPSSRMILIHGKEGGQHSTFNFQSLSENSKSLSENFERQFDFGLKPALTPALSPRRGGTVRCSLVIRNRWGIIRVPLSSMKKRGLKP